MCPKPGKNNIRFICGKYEPTRSNWTSYNNIGTYSSLRVNETNPYTITLLNRQNARLKKIWMNSYYYFCLPLVRHQHSSSFLQGTKIQHGNLNFEQLYDLQSLVKFFHQYNKQGRSIDWPWVK